MINATLYVVTHGKITKYDVITRTEKGWRVKSEHNPRGEMVYERKVPSYRLVKVALWSDISLTTVCPNEAKRFAIQQINNRKQDIISENFELDERLNKVNL